MKKPLLIICIIILTLSELYLISRLVLVYSDNIQKKNAQECTYHLRLGNIPFCLNDNNDGFLTPKNNTQKWEILQETPKNIIALQPDGTAVKLKKANNHLIPDRLTIDEQIEIEYQKADYTPAMPYIILNPYGKTPLSALLRFRTDKPSRVQLTIKGMNSAPDLSFDYPSYSIEHTIPVIGLYPKYNNKLILKISTKNISKEYPLTIQTDIAGRDIFYFPLQKKDTENHFYSSYDGLIYDEYGFIRYALNNIPEMIYIFNGEIIAEVRQKGLTRLSILGKELQYYPYPPNFSSFCHGIGRMPNGNFLVIGTQKGTLANIEGTFQETHRDIILELDYNSGKEVKRWDIAEILNPDRSVIVRSAQKDYGAIDWLHMNSVQYDPSDNSIVLSGRHVGMVKFDYNTGHLKWVFGPKQGYNKSGRDGKGSALWDKVLTAVDKAGNPLPEAIQKGVESSPNFQWPTTTHDATVLGNGYFSIFNNDAHAYDKKIIANQDSRGMIFKIDEINKTIHQVWSKSTGLFSGVGSNIDILADTNDIVVYLSEIIHDDSRLKYGHLYRYDHQTKQPLFEAVLHRHDNGWHYRLEPIDIKTLILSTPDFNQLTRPIIQSDFLSD